ncbi:MAG: DUF3850 domain-containing protein [Candidatus Micrarchaeota archaeon]|nr:DUF3850 domain-containing protein [Candidatus Micrarchaeota archaeon]
MKIEKKIWPRYFKDVKSKKKSFEVRLADFRCKPGDVLVLREWDPKKKVYTGRKIQKKVKYVAKLREMKFYNRKQIENYGLQVIGI